MWKRKYQIWELNHRALLSLSKGKEDRFWVYVDGFYHFFWVNPWEEDHLKIVTVPVLDQLLVLKYRGSVDDICSICLKPLRRKLGRLNACGHIFHRKCIERALKFRDSCPVCRIKPVEGDLRLWHSRLCLPNGYLYKFLKQVCVEL